MTEPLKQQAARLRSERDLAQADLRSARAEIERLTGSRNEWKDHCKAAQFDARGANRHADKMQAERDHYREALERIVQPHFDGARRWDIARMALAPSEETT